MNSRSSAARAIPAAPVLTPGCRRHRGADPRPTGAAQQPVGGNASSARREFSAIAADRSVRAVVLAANGPAFCAGHDLKELTARRADADRGRAYFADLMTRCAAMMQAIVHLPQPVIAGVHGTATAAGCQLVATCDLAVASSAATFCTPGVNIGLFCSTPMVALTRNVAPKHAMEMLLTGDAISADEAHRIGLVNRVVPPGTERDAARALAAKIAAKSAHRSRSARRRSIISARWISPRPIATPPASWSRT